MDEQWPVGGVRGDVIRTGCPGDHLVRRPQPPPEDVIRTGCPGDHLVRRPQGPPPTYDRGRSNRGQGYQQGHYEKRTESWLSELFD